MTDRSARTRCRRVLAAAASTLLVAAGCSNDTILQGRPPEPALGLHAGDAVLVGSSWETVTAVGPEWIETRRDALELLFGPDADREGTVARVDGEGHPWFQRVTREAGAGPRTTWSSPFDADGAPRTEAPPGWDEMDDARPELALRHRLDDLPAPLPVLCPH